MKSLIIFLGILVIAFGALLYVNNIEPIDDVLSNPQEYKDEDVRVMGKIERKIDYGAGTVTLISHDKAVIPILSQGYVPKVGENIVAEGNVHPGLHIGNTDLGTYIQADEIRKPHVWEKIPLEKVPSKIRNLPRDLVE